MVGFNLRLRLLDRGLLVAGIRWRLLGWMLRSAAAGGGRLLDSRVAWRRGSGLLIPGGRVFTLVSRS